MFKYPFSPDDWSPTSNPEIKARGFASTPTYALLVWFLNYLTTVRIPTIQAETRFVCGCSTVYVYITSVRTNNRSWWRQALHTHLKQAKIEMSNTFLAKHKQQSFSVHTVLFYIKNTWKVLKCGAGEGWRRSFGPTMWEMKKYYLESRSRGISYMK
jgi:hypothetical protein